MSGVYTPYTPGYNPSDCTLRYTVDVSAVCGRRKVLSRHEKRVRFVMALLTGNCTVRFTVIHDAYISKTVSLSLATNCGKDFCVCSL